MPDVIAIQHLDTALAAGERPVAAYREAMQAGEGAIARRFDAGDEVSILVHARATLIDALLIRAWRHFLGTAAAAALVAVGGYGRRELHPASDIDFMVLVDDGEPGQALAPAIAEFVTFLWDIGLEVGHSVRTVEECVAAASDLSVITNLTEARLITGSPSLLDALRHAITPDRLWSSAEFFRAKMEEQAQRYRRYDDTAYKLEPNIKGTPGGLRDIQMIHWVAKRHFGADRLSQLVEHGFLTQEEYHALHEGQEHLWRIRFALHLLAGRREDRLLFDHQRALAARFGHESDDANLAVEKFMQSYYRTVMELGRLNEMLLQYFRESILLQDQCGAPVVINRRFQARDGYLEVRDPQIFVRYPLALLELFLILQQHPELQGVRASTIRLVRVHRHLVDRRLRASLAARSLFMEIFRQPTGLTHALRRMNRYGILAAYLPAFAQIVGRMQYDLYHAYTVDEHTLFLIRNLRRLTVAEFRHEFPLLSNIIDRLPKQELIYVAGLFHDIAKGRGGDHSKLGARDAIAFCREHALSDYDGRLVAWLVENHLLMSMTAQRKDIDDPQVIQSFGEAVGDQTRLDYLYLLTVADIRATNPQRWNTWKDALLRQLFYKTQHALARGLDNPQAQEELVHQKQLETRRLLEATVADEASVTQLWSTLNADYFLGSTPDEIAWQTRMVLNSKPEQRPLVLVRTNQLRGGTEIFVCATDRDKLFAVTTQLIDQLGLNVMDARIQTAGVGCTMNSFLVLEEDGSAIEDELRIDEIISTLRHGLAEGEAIAANSTRRMPRRLKEFDIPTEIELNSDSVHDRTMLRLRTSDRPGLLSLVGYAFAECGVRLISAKISTIGEQVEDLFIVCNRRTGSALDHEQEDCLAAAVRQRIEKAA